MFGFSKQLVLSGLVLGLSAAAALASSSYEGSAEGGLYDWDTVDYVYIEADDDQSLDIYIDAEGTGTNWFTVKIQQETAVGGWDTLDSDGDTMPSASLRFGLDVRNYVVGSKERVRVRMSRSLGTQGIAWSVGVNWE